MIKDLVPGWQVELDRGPNWLFVRLIDQEQAAGSESDEKTGVANAILNLSDHEFIRRLVLEMDHVPALDGEMVDELLTLQQQINERGGVLRLCGLNDDARESLKQNSAMQRLPSYRDRREAIMGALAPQGRG